MEISPLHIKTFASENLKELNIRNVRGNLECFAHSESQVRIEVFASKFSLYSFKWESLDKEEFAELGFRIYQKDEQISVLKEDALYTGFLSFLDLTKVCFRVFLPKDFSCILETGMGDIRLAGLTGTQQFRTHLGNIFLDNLDGKMQSLGKNFGHKVVVNSCHGKVDIRSGGSLLEIKNCSGQHQYHTEGGNIRVANFEGNLNCKSTGGNIRVENFDGELKANTLGGNINAERFRGSMTANTFGGNILVETPQINHYLWLETNGGNIHWAFNSLAGFDLEAKGGKIKTSGTFNFEGYRAEQRMAGKINDGGANVRLKTNGGKVRLTGEPKTDEKPGKSPAYSSPSPVTEWPKSEKKPEIKIASEEKTKFKTSPQIELDHKMGQLPKMGQVFLALIGITLLVYGLNTIVYFTTELFNAASEDATLSKAIFFLNLINGITAFVSLWLFILFIDRRIQMLWLKYLILTLLTYFLYFSVHGLLINYIRGLPEPGIWQFYIKTSTPSSGFTMVNILKIILFQAVPALAVTTFYTLWHSGSKLSRRINEQDIQLLTLEKLKTKAQLNALEARINPHFLYNSLNSIVGLIHDDPDKAEDMTIELSKLFRATTGRQNESFHSIEEEISLVKSYLAIEQMRFGDRLTYKIDVDPTLLSHRIPRFLLQPLVENAIKHGISKITQNGLLTLEIKSLDNKISIEIHDNGPGFGQAISGGYGLKSVQDKLDLIYEDKASLKIVDEPIKKLTIILDKNDTLQNHFN